MPDIEPRNSLSGENYVFHGGAVRKWRQAAVQGSTVPQDAKRENDLMRWASHANGTLSGHGSRAT